MSGLFKSVLMAGIAVSALFSAACPGFAGAFAIREQSAEDLGNAFAGAATSGSSLSSMFWNPATMTSHQGINSTSLGTGILPFANVRTTIPASTLPDSGNIGEAAFVPASSFSYQVNDSIWAGLTLNSPFGLSTKASQASNGGIYGQSSDVRSLNIQPTIAYKLNDMLSFGVGLAIQRFSIHLTSLDPAALYGLVPPGAKFISYDDLTGHSWGVGFTAGATIKPMAGTEIGIGYRSQIKQNLSGNITAIAVLGSTATAAIKSNITLPDQVNIGIRQKITNDLNVMAGFEWTHWSIFNSFPVTLASNGAPLTSLGFKYRDGWMASLGADYKATQDLTLRAGLAYETSPISDAVRSVRLPDNNRVWTSLGLSYALGKKMSFDVGYTHIFPVGTKIAINCPASPACGGKALPAYAANVSSHIDIVSVGLNYRWDDPKAMDANELPKKAIVRKY